MNRSRYYGVYERGGEYYTKNLVKGPFFGEKIVKEKNEEYRYWDPYRSKLSAAMKKGLKTFPFRVDSHVLYLGASFGNTVSYISDICVEGKIFAIEKAIKPFSSLLTLSGLRKNIFPILEDANHPERFNIFVDFPDIIYQDIAQKEQTEIFLKNLDFFETVKTAFLFLKTRAVDTVSDPKALLKNEIKKIENVFEVIDIHPYERDHFLIVVKR